MLEHELYEKVGARVRAAREAARLTQEELGRRIGLTRASVTNIEKARQNVQLHTLYDIARVLDVPVTALLPSVTEPAGSGVEGVLAGLESDYAPPEQRWIRDVLAHSGSEPDEEENR